MRARLLTGVLLLVGCGGLSADPGTRALLRVSAATVPLQYLPGAMPGESGGPTVRSADLSIRTFALGQEEIPFQGALDPAATAVALGLDGDAGYWVAGADVPDVATPELPAFDVELGFAAGHPAGPERLTVRAVDAQGRFGAAQTLDLTLTDAPLPSGRLVVRLAWSGTADLDLHVVTPDGAEIWSRKPSAAGGLLDADSNPECAFDGRDREQVTFADAPPPGRYVVRVDAFSLCGAIEAAWQVEALLDGQSLGRAAGIALPSDTRGDHALGSGRTALELDVPALP